MVFFLTCAAVDFWERALTSLQAEAIREVVGAVLASPAEAKGKTSGPLKLLGLHGKMVQKKRTGMFAQFRAARSVRKGEDGGAVLLCTVSNSLSLPPPSPGWGRSHL
jgi:superfamily II DNA/RNA helicase